MSVSNPLSARFDHIAREYSHKFETRADWEAAVARAYSESGDWFAYATKPQKAAHTAALADLYGDHFPRANRARDAAKAAFYASTDDAAQLCLLAFEDHLRDGEIHPDTAEAFELLTAKSERVAA